MNRLYIISESEQSGSAFAQITLGLSSPQFKVITSLKDLAYVPNNILFVHDDNHPVDSVEISRELSMRGNFNLKDKTYLFEYIGRLYEDIQLVNNIFSAMTNQVSTEHGYNQIKARFDARGLTKLNGFNYQLGRRTDTHQFYFVPDNGPMETILNLYRSYYLTKIQPQYKVESIPIGKPL